MSSSDVLDQHTGEGSGDDWDFDALWTELKTLYPVGVTIDEVISEAGNKGRINRDFMRREILSDAKIAYQKREESARRRRRCASWSGASCCR